MYRTPERHGQQDDNDADDDGAMTIIITVITTIVFEGLRRIALPAGVSYSLRDRCLIRSRPIRVELDLKSHHPRPRVQSTSSARFV
jgi:hypothetical protein